MQLSTTSTGLTSLVSSLPIMSCAMLTGVHDNGRYAFRLSSSPSLYFQVNHSCFTSLPSVTVI